MLKLMMSLLAVSLLATTLAAATTAHKAHSVHSLTSAASGKLNEDYVWLPYYVCKSLCPGRCNICNRAAPCGASCLCEAARDSTDFKKASAASAAIAAQEATSKMKSADWCLFPQAECSDKCPGVCVCSLILPTPEYCFCSPRIALPT